MLVIYMVAMLGLHELKPGFVVTEAAARGPSSWRPRRPHRRPRRAAPAGARRRPAHRCRPRLLALIDRTASAGAVAWRTALVGAGLGLSLPALTAAGMSALPPAIRGLGSGVLNTARQLGFLLGVAVLVAVFAHTMQTAVGRAADQAKAMTDASTAIPADLKPEVAAAIDSARSIDVSLGMSEIRKVAHPIALLIEPRVGPLEGVALLGLKGDLEKVFMDEAAGAFRWPLLTAAIAALLALIPSAMLPLRLPRPTSGLRRRGARGRPRRGAGPRRAPAPRGPAGAFRSRSTPRRTITLSPPITYDAPPFFSARASRTLGRPISTPGR